MKNTSWGEGGPQLWASRLNRPLQGKTILIDSKPQNLFSKHGGAVKMTCSPNSVEALYLSWCAQPRETRIQVKLALVHCSRLYSEGEKGRKTACLTVHLSFLAMKDFTLVIILQCLHLHAEIPADLN